MTDDELVAAVVRLRVAGCSPDVITAALGRDVADVELLLLAAIGICARLAG